MANQFLILISSTAWDPVRKEYTSGEPLVINNLRTDTYTNTHNNFSHKSNFKKPGSFGWCVPSLKIGPVTF